MLLHIMQSIKQPINQKRLHGRCIHPSARVFSLGMIVEIVMIVTLQVSANLFKDVLHKASAQVRPGRQASSFR